MGLELWLEKNLGYEIPKPGLERIRSAIRLLDLDFSKKKIITIGGTNGKGETSREFYRLASSFGSCALWTSPHLVSVTERFSRDGNLVSNEELERYFISTLEILLKAELKLSYYEFLFLVFLRFAADCEILVLEVGLGGRFDAVNAMDADLVLLTSISRDHQDYLGARYDQILGEKIPLSRPGKTLVSNFELRYLRQFSRAYCQERGIEYVDLFELGLCSNGLHFSQRNRAAARFGVEKILGPVEESLVEASLSARSPIIEFSLGGAQCHGLTSHNPDGVRKGVQFLNHGKYTDSYRLALLSFSNRDPKDAMTMIKTIEQWSRSAKSRIEIVLTSFEHPKAMGRSELKALANKAQVNFVDDVEEIFQTYDLGSQKILVVGSNYFLGSLLGRGSRG